MDLDIGVQGELAPEIRVRKLFDDQRVVPLQGRRQRPKLTHEELARKPHVTSLAAAASVDRSTRRWRGTVCRGA